MLRHMDRRRIGHLLIVAVGVSVVHYADNTLNFADFPEPTSGPAPSRVLIGASWFAFTAVAVAAWVVLRRGPSAGAALLLGLYSASGLVGLGHYTVPGALEMPWWRHAHVVADIACGAALLLVALRVGAAARRPVST